MGEDIGGPDTGVPGLEPPMWRGEFIIHEPAGLDIGSEVAGE